jgi:hypothetical protein
MTGPVFSTRGARWIVYGWMAVLLVAVAVLSVRAISEPARQRAEVARQLRVDCAFYGDLAGAPLPPNASDLGRRIIHDAGESYDQRGCARVAGPRPTRSTPTPRR